MRAARPLGLALALLAAPLAGCVGPEEAAPGPDRGPDAMRVASLAFVPGERIPSVFTCDGREVSPPFTVAGLPNGTETVALVAADPDVPTPQTGARNFTHWLFWNAEPNDTRLRVPRNGTPDGAVEGTNGGGERGYAGPCPPVGSPPHRYVFTFLAADTRLDLDAGANRSRLEAALDGHVLERATLVGTYERQVAPLTLFLSLGPRRLARGDKEKRSRKRNPPRERRRPQRR